MGMDEKPVGDVGSAYDKGSTNIYQRSADW